MYKVGSPPVDKVTCKRLYIPLSGQLVEDSARGYAIILVSSDEYSWDWGGYGNDQKMELGQTRSELKEIVSKLTVKTNND